MGCLGGMSFPAISSIKANNVDVHEQGQIQGALYGARALAVRNQQPPPPPSSMYIFNPCYAILPSVLRDHCSVEC